MYAFGLFTTDIFVNAGQVVTGNLAPHFLTVCKPNFTALGCQQALRYISHQEACTGNVDDILRARKTFPSKEAALSVYAALYLAVSLVMFSFLLFVLSVCYSVCSVRVNGTKLAEFVTIRLACPKNLPFQRGSAECLGCPSPGVSSFSFWIGFSLDALRKD